MAKLLGKRSNPGSLKLKAARTILVGLSIASTVTGLGILTSACQSFENNWAERETAPSSAYARMAEAGDSARDLLSSKHFKRLIVEIQSMPGQAPTQDTINQFQTFLESNLKKPGGITITPNTEIPAGDGIYGLEDVRDIERKNRRHYSNGNQIAVYFLFVDGKSRDDTAANKKLGEAHLNGSVVIYENTLRGKLAGYPDYNLALLETPVMAHEFGHLMGLVNTGRSSHFSDQEDSNHSGHCTNPNCLMYHSMENGRIFTSQQAEKIPEFDPACRQALERIAEE
jgi:predicted Zn-dependent protease